MAKKIVTYKARETPSNPQSNVLIKHRLHIKEKSRSGNDVTWDVWKLTFIQPGGGNWTDASPGLSSWVVTHEKPDNPVASEFTNPPNMSGTADNVASGDDLIYSFTLGSCTLVEQQMYDGAVACAAYSYVAGTTEIAEEDEDEPEELDLEEDPI